MMVKPRRCCDRHVRSRRMEPGRNWGVWDMHVGLTMFPTDYAVPPHDLAVAAEARGYDSLWLPEHSHIPTSRKSPWPGGAELPKYYYDTYDPFLSLAAAIATALGLLARAQLLSWLPDMHIMTILLRVTLLCMLGIGVYLVMARLF